MEFHFLGAGHAAVFACSPETKPYTDQTSRPMIIPLPPIIDKRSTLATGGNFVKYHYDRRIFAIRVGLSFEEVINAVIGRKGEDGAFGQGVRFKTLPCKGM